MRSRAWFVAAVAVMAVQVFPMQETVSAQNGVVSTDIVISELRFSGPNGDNDEFIELFNLGDTAVEIGGWTVRVAGPTGTTNLQRAMIPTDNKSLVGPGCYYLLAFGGAGNYSLNNVAAPDHAYTVGFGDTGSVAILRTNGSFADRVGFAPQTLYREGTALAGAFSQTQRSYERLPGSPAGHADGGNNATDFQLLANAAPQNSGSPCVEQAVLPHDVQGNGHLSPMRDMVKTVRGVVTARSSDGFFIETESDRRDLDASTSDGVFVFTAGPAPAAAQVGRVVKVKGTVREFVPDADPGSPSRTQMSSVISVTDAGAATPSDPYVLTPEDLSDTGTLDQLEHLEGMRVQAPSLTAVSGTDANGVFYAVRTGQARPFREPGVESGYPALPCAMGPCNVPLFDANPERLRVDSDGLAGATATQLSSGAVMTNVTGPLSFDARTYTLLPESLAPTGGTPVGAVPAAAATRYTVASFNAQRAADVPEAVWLEKASRLLRTVMRLPDVVAVQGVDGAALSLLATEVNSDAGTSYSALFATGSDVGFLVGGRVSGASYAQVGDAETFGAPSLLLTATINGPSTSLPQAIAVLVNHLEPVNGDLARRKAQADVLAGQVQLRQLNDPNEALVVLGDFNAFSFNDGLVDTVGTVAGTPSPETDVAFASSDVVSSDLVELGASLPAVQRYSFVANGNAQTHEHMLVSANIVPRFQWLSRPRVNGDFPAALRHDDTTASAVSAKDPVVASFTFPPDVTAPVFGAAPDRQAEATSAAGAAVSFPTPVATDNLDAVVAVTCLPASGSVFALGNSGVTCSATDAAGNPAAVSFTVSVGDTAGPVVSVPAAANAEATSSAGAVVTFAASAVDAVSGSLTPSCSPASGATFALGATTVACTASDTVGNVGQASFVVTVADQTAPALTVPGNIQEEATSSAGRVVTYAASATDAVNGSVAVLCTPASGSTFPIGATVVNCAAWDAAGNDGHASFSVTISALAPEPTELPGRMRGDGGVGAEQQRVAFAFDVVESARSVERGWLKLTVKNGAGRPSVLEGAVNDISFSNDAAYKPGGSPRSGVDTVTFSGRGSWNGRAGYRFDVRASDRGEPGAGRDTFQVVVISPKGETVVSTFGVLRSGNVQSVRPKLDPAALARARAFARALRREGGR